MADISLNQVSKYFGDRQILCELTFDIQPGEKVAILGANGAGKTTLLNLVTGALPLDGGTLSIASGRSVGIIDQLPVFDEAATVEDVLRLAFRESDDILAAMEELTAQMAAHPEDKSLLRRYAALETRLDLLGGYNRDFEVDKVCSGLSLPENMRAQPFRLLSGGEKTRVNLARIILEHTDILLLDEPTNHLDMDAVGWLGDYLESYRGTVLTVSHDRWFLDRCCDRIIELSQGKCEFYAGNYSFYAVERERRRENQLKQHTHEQAEKDRLEATARKMHEHGTEHLAKRAASIEKRIARMKVTDRPRTDKQMNVRFGDPNYETEEVLIARDLKKTYEGRTIFSDVSFTLRNRERAAILGANGAGKTTLLRLLLAQETADEGAVRRGVGLRPAYLPQQVSFANENRTLIDTLLYDKNVTVQTARDRLGAFQFSGETQEKTVSVLSGGEKSRLALCELMYDPLNLLILDEPTNHLDLASREWIEQAVEAFDGTLLFVSHDRYFVERFATRILYLENGSLIDFTGSYEQFLSYRESGRLPSFTPAAPQKKQRATPTLGDVPDVPRPQKRTGGTKALQKALSGVEREISALERQSAALEEEMLAASSDSVRLLELMGEKETCDEQLTAKMDEWEALSTELDTIQ